MTFSRKFDFSHTGWGVYVAIFPSFRLEKHFYSDKMLSGSRENTSKFQKCRFRHKNQVKMYVENEEIRKKSYGFLKIPPGGIPFRLILHPFLLLFRRPRPPQATLRTSSAAPEEICLSSYSSAKAPVSSLSLSVLFSGLLCYTTLLDVRIGCQNRIASSKNQKRNHNQMTEMKSQRSR